MQVSDLIAWNEQQVCEGGGRSQVSPTQTNREGGGKYGTKTESKQRQNDDETQRCERAAETLRSMQALLRYVKICADWKHLLPSIYHPKDINQLLIKFWYHGFDAGLLTHDRGKGLSDEPILEMPTLMTDRACENSFFTAGTSKTARFHTRSR